MQVFQFFGPGPLETLLEISEKTNPTIILAEEPEIYLHTHLERFFRRILVSLAAKGNHIFFTTHSEQMIDLTRFGEIVRLTKNDLGQTAVNQVSPNTKFDVEKFKTKIKGKGNEELFFCRHAILLEGQDDKAVLGATLAALGVDADLLSIGIFDCGGILQIPDYARMCHELGIDFFIIHDVDNEKDPAIKARNNAIASQVDQTKPKLPSLFYYDQTLEDALKTTKQSQDNWKHLLDIVEKGAGKIRTEYPKLVEPIDKFLESRKLKV